MGDVGAVGVAVVRHGVTLGVWCGAVGISGVPRMGRGSICAVGGIGFWAEVVVGRVVEAVDEGLEVVYSKIVVSHVTLDGEVEYAGGVRLDRGEEQLDLLMFGLGGANEAEEVVGLLRFGDVGRPKRVDLCR